MNDEQAKALGERALALGMPWVDGVRDGAERRRLGDYLDCGCCLFGEEDACLDEVWKPVWPDFRDAVTEAWLVAWALRYCDDHSPWNVMESRGVGAAGEWCIINELGGRDNTLAVSLCRAEAWILALENLKGEG